MAIPPGAALLRQLSRLGRWLALAFALLLTPVAAQEVPVAPLSWRAGDCAQLREGGGGGVLKAPSYWLRGRIETVEVRRHRAGVCPHAGKPPSLLKHTEWQALVAASPCVARAEEVRELDVPRVLLQVEAWETPWTKAQGHAGMLFRGRFLDQELVQGMRLAIDAHWLERCPDAASQGSGL